MQGGMKAKRAKSRGRRAKSESKERQRAKADFKLGRLDADLDLFGGASGFVCSAHRCQALLNVPKFRHSGHFVCDGTFGFGFSPGLFATL